MFSKVIFVFILLFSIATEATSGGKRCSGVACIEMEAKKDSYTTVTISAKSGEPLLCYAKYDGRGFTFELRGTSKTFYLRKNYPSTGISWRCDAFENRCPVWAGSYCARKGISFG